MALSYRKETVDPVVHYAGKTLPKDKAQLTVETVDPNVVYNGRSLPADKVEYVAPTKDLSNDPGLVVLGPITLPADTAIYINGKKVLAESKILDGVSVFERIQRDPYEIEFEIILRQKNSAGVAYVFPQQLVQEIWEKIWLPDSVLDVQNTYLNGLGVFQIVVDSISPTTVRGSTNLPVRLHCFENVLGKSIIV